jgi:hypothetical protein
MLGASRKLFLKNRFLFLGIGIFVLFAALYSFTAPQGMYLIDSGEFITAVKSFGIAHPPGFPTYVLLAKLFSFLPFGNIAFKVNLFSAITSAAALAVLFACVRALGKLHPHFDLPVWAEAIIPFLAMLALGTGSVFWGQSNVAEVYSLNLLFVVCLFWLTLKFRLASEWKYLFITAFIAGIGLGNHPILVFFLPAFIVIVLAARPKWSWKYITYAILLFILGCSVYLFLPLRSAMHPALDWGHTSRGLINLYNHLIRGDYHDYGNFVPVAEKFKFLISFFSTAWHEFGPAVILAVPGIWFMRRQNKLGFWATALVFLANLGSMVLVRSVYFSAELEVLYAQNYLPAFAMLAIWIIFGIYGLYGSILFAVRKPGRIMVLVGSIILLLGSLFWAAPKSFNQNNLRNFKFLDNYTRYLLNVEPNAVIIFSPEGSEIDTVGFALLYGQQVLGLRPDIKVLFYPNVINTPYEAQISEIYNISDIHEQRRAFLEFALNNPEYGARPIYSTFLAESASTGLRLYSRSNGYLYKINEVGPEPPALPYIGISIKDKNIMESNYFGKDVLAQLYYSQAALAVQQGNESQAQKFYVEAINLDNDLFGLDMEGYKIFRNHTLGLN